MTSRHRSLLGGYPLECNPEGELWDRAMCVIKLNFRQKITPCHTLESLFLVLISPIVEDSGTRKVDNGGEDVDEPEISSEGGAGRFIDARVFRLQRVRSTKSSSATNDVSDVESIELVYTFDQIGE